MTGPERAASSARQRRYRERGRQVAFVIRDPEAIAALERGIAAHGGGRGALLAAVCDAVKLAYPDRSGKGGQAAT